MAAYSQLTNQEKWTLKLKTKMVLLELLYPPPNSIFM